MSLILYFTQIDVNTMCHLTQPDMSVDDDVRKAIVDNLKRIPSLRWQFYGTEDRRHCTYPARSACDQSKIFDPRVRCVGGFTGTNPEITFLLLKKPKL